MTEVQKDNTKGQPGDTAPTKKKENPLLSLMFNIILPVAALQNLSKHLGENGPLWALLIGLSLPIGYGIYDYVTRREKNLMSVIGIISVVFTGGLALVQAEGIWFAVVEMGLPLIFGIAVLVSAFTSSPFIAKMTYNEVFMHIDKVEAALKERDNLQQFKKLLRTSTLFLS
ncbi:MAG: VC0807 family protein, partial [Pseudomonadota bacterium]